MSTRLKADAAIVPIFIVAMSHGVTLPILPTFIVEVLGGPLYGATLYVVAAAGVSIILHLLISRLPQSVHPAIVARFSLLWLAIGSVMISMATHFAQLTIIGLVFASTFHVPMSYFLSTPGAAHKRTGALSVKRIAYYIGIGAGALFAGFMVKGGLPMQHVFVLQASGYVVCLAASLLLCTRETVRRKREGARSLNGGLLKAPKSIVLLVLIVFFSLLGDSGRGTLVPLVLKDQLDADDAQIGIAYTVFSVSYVLAAIAAPVLERHLTAKWVIALSALCGSAFFGLLFYASDIWQIYVLHALYAMVPATLTTIALSSLQTEAEAQADLGVTSLYYASQQAALFVGGGIAILLLYLQETLIIPFLCYAVASAISVALAMALRLRRV